MSTGLLITIIVMGVLIIGMIVLYLIQPLLERLLHGPARQKKIDAVFVLAAVLFLADLLARIWLGSNFTS